MKILHIIESGGLYGAESVILNLSREMQKRGYYCPVIGCIVSSMDEKSDLYDKAIEYGLCAEKLVIRNTWLPIDIPKAALRIRRTGISLIHSHGYKPSVFGFIIHLLTWIPIIATCHLWFLKGKVPLKMHIMVAIELFLYKFFPIVVAVSEPIRQILIASGVNASKVVVIRNGIVIEDYSRLTHLERDAKKKELGVKAGELCILNVGRLSHQKAQWHILTAAHRLQTSGHKIKFFIVGDGPLRNRLEEQMKKLRLGNYVYLLGFRSDIKELLQIADVFVLPSLDEGMPIALLEAAASHTAIICTPVGDTTKLIEDNKSGLLINVDDSEALITRLEELLSSESLRDFLAESALERVRLLYSSKIMYDQYDKIYTQIIT